MTAIFHSLVYQPFYNILIFLYNIIPGGDFGIAIIAATIFIKVALLPLSKKQIESQKKMQEVQPEIKKIQQKYKDDKEKQTKAIMKFYKENDANPFSGCLPLIIQLIFLIAVYRVIITISNAGLVVDSNDLYSFIKNPGEINKLFLGIVDLSKQNIYLAFLAAGAQFWQTKMMILKNKKTKPKQQKKKDNKDNNPAKPDFSEIMNKQMLFLGPGLTLFIGIKFAAGLILYWLVSTLFSALQQLYILKKDAPKKNIA